MKDIPQTGLAEIFVTIALHMKVMQRKRCLSMDFVTPSKVLMPGRALMSKLLLAELLGTFWLVFGGRDSAVSQRFTRPMLWSIQRSIGRHVQ